MSWNDLVGLLVSLAAFLYVMFSYAFKERRSLDEDEEEEIVLPREKKIPVIKSESRPSKTIVTHYFEELAKAAPYIVEGKARPSRIHRLLSQVKSKKDLIIFTEIIGPPKSL